MNAPDDAHLTEPNPATLPERLVKRLGSRNSQVADEAAQSLLALGDVGVGYLIADLRRSRKFQWPRAFCLTVSIHTILFALLNMLPAPRLFGTHGSWSGAAGGIILYILFLSMYSPRHRRALRTLVRVRNPVVLPVLLGEHRMSAPAVLNVIVEAITFHLPGMSVDDTLALDTKQRDQLYAVLKWQTNSRDKEKLAAATRMVLHSLWASKDTLALPGVKHLASGEGLAKQYPDIQKLAQEVLTLLQPQAVTDQQATLLRAGSAPLAPETLLRSAANTDSDAPQTLLRSAAHEHPTPPQPVKSPPLVEENTRLIVGWQEEREP